jgi:hypothetical protein
MKITRTTALATSLATIGLAATAGSASAYSFTSSEGGAPVPVGTPFTLGGGAIQVQNSVGTTWMTCMGSTLNGVTGSRGASNISSQLNVTSGSWNGCKVGAQNIFYTVNASQNSPWQIVPTSGTNSPFGSVVDGVNLTVRCGSPTSSSATYTGSLTSGVSETNLATGLQITLATAGNLAKSGTGCPALPNPASVTQTNTVTSVGGAPVSSTNNLWLNP